MQKYFHRHSFLLPRSCLKMWTGVDVIKLFFSSLTEWQSKLDRLFFRIVRGAYQSGAHQGAKLYGYALAWTLNSGLLRETLWATNNLAYFSQLGMERKKVLQNV
jgi:hypothetical protein